MLTKCSDLSRERSCPLCGWIKSKPCLIGRPDYEYGLVANFDYVKCVNPNCGLVYMKELPSLDVIQGFYTEYSTHNLYIQSKLGMAISYISMFSTKRHLDSIFAGRDLTTQKVLDYGCGAGSFMTLLTSHGVRKVFGYDFDPKACRCAQDLGLTVWSTEEEFLKQGPYDFVFLNHVIEHLADPVDTLLMLAGSLNQGGRLVLRTPNASSFLSRLFADNWRGWETPRHLHIFNPRNIRNLVSKFGRPELKLVSVETSNAMFIGMFHESFHLVFWRGGGIRKLVRHMLCFALLPVAFAVNWVVRSSGEEVVFIVELFEEK